MGLFDRFRKKVVQADEEARITAEEGTAEAEEALQIRESLKARQNRIREQIEEVPEHKNDSIDPSFAENEEMEWDELED